MDRECKELPTHIGVELSFMNFLCEREVEALQNEEGDGWNDKEERKDTDSIRYRELQIRFLQEHLNLWFSELSQSIQANAKSQLYRGLALITEEFLRWDTAGLLTQSPVEKHMRAQKTSMQPQTG
jgi:TorA maturation chaperone TorD